MTCAPAGRHPCPTHLSLRAVGYDHAHAQELVRALHREQCERYTFADDPADASVEEFRPPGGVFLVGYVGSEPVACGGWRTYAPPVVAEVKRMYVRHGHRGCGHGRRLLAALERSAHRAGMTRVILETGVRNVEAIALYTRAGYARMDSYVAGRDPAINVAFGKDLDGRRRAWTG